MDCRPFAGNSFAGAFPSGGDLFLEKVFTLDDDELLDEGLGYAVYIPEHQIAWIDVIGESDDD